MVAVRFHLKALVSGYWGGKGGSQANPIVYALRNWDSSSTDVKSGCALFSASSPLFLPLFPTCSEAEAPVREEKLSVSTSTSPCWLVEEFVVTEECTPCSNFQIKTTPECGSTGYVEKITCSSSKRNEFKSCRSALLEQHLFWKFEGIVVGVALVFACLVIIRQRQLDRKALEKVRKQIESI